MAKKCPPGKYYCFDEKKCKKIPRGYRIGARGYLAREKEDDSEDSKKNGGNGNGSNGGNGNGNGAGGNGGGNGGSNGGGMGESIVYERKMTEKEKRKDDRLKKKYDKSDMKKSMQKQYGKEEGKKVYFATIRKQAMEEESNPRIPRKKGQPAKSKKHSDLYTDEDPKGTIHGLGFKDVATAKASVSKIRGSSRSHAHKIQAAVAMEQRAREMGKTSEAAVYRKYINSMKKKTKKMNENVSLSFDTSKPRLGLNAKVGGVDIRNTIDNVKTAVNAAKNIKSTGGLVRGIKKTINDKKVNTTPTKSVETKVSDAITAYNKNVNEEGLRDWFGKSSGTTKSGRKVRGWVQVGGKYDGKPCARQPGQKSTPKCVSSAKRRSMSKDERDSAARRKRKADPNQPNKTGAAKPTMVSTDPKKKMKEQKSFSQFRRQINESPEILMEIDRELTALSLAAAKYGPKLAKFGRTLLPKIKSGLGKLSRKIKPPEGLRVTGPEAMALKRGRFVSADKSREIQIKSLADKTRKYVQGEYPPIGGGTRKTIPTTPNTSPNTTSKTRGMSSVKINPAEKSSSELTNKYIKPNQNSNPNKIKKVQKDINKDNFEGDTTIKSSHELGGTVMRENYFNRKKVVEEKKETPKNVKKIAKELDAAVKMHTSQAKRLRAAGISETNISEAERKLSDRMERKQKLMKKTVNKAMNFARNEGEASGHARYNMGRLGSEIEKLGKKRRERNEEVVIEAKDKKGKGSGTKDACYHKVKARYDVWPSAYASGALVKCRKVGAANWGNKSKNEGFSPMQVAALEAAGMIEIKEGQKCWKGYEKKGTKMMFGKRYNNCVKKKKTRKEEVEHVNEEGINKDPAFNIMRPGGKNSPLNADGTPKGNPKDTAIMRMSGNPIKIKAGDIADKVKNKVKNFLNRPIIAPTINKKTHQQMINNKGVGYQNGQKFDTRYDHYEPKGKVLEAISMLKKKEEKKTEKKPRDAGAIAKKIMQQKEHEKYVSFLPANVDEGKVRFVKNGHTYNVVLTWRGKRYMLQMFIPDVTRPTRQEIEKEVNKLYPDAKVISFLPKEFDPTNPTVMVPEENQLQEDDMKGMSVKSGHKRPTEKGAGMTAKGVAAYRRRNPGSKLKTAVTGKVKKGSKDAKRRKSYCARSAGQMKKFPKAAKDPNSRLRQARRRWKC